ncbi:DivIVA domain-containing protein [Micromonospora sp. 4G57]|uniref:DivIVA domain-containing protein n=1 Tax=Micromonospora sicca TaxID=2202420 RepID=A0ABU5JC15_9ACTN|nr:MULTISPECIES: DivIVA domain-containing protein [unclassified Micromonospora]MDZ5446614.1 DivIVA domain-containing protein [Micromonospora sp. 4G57]MDZ5490135.1 DivIVA domain-containing protein [Micromonospora sp. 4G53]
MRAFFRRPRRLGRAERGPSSCYRSSTYVPLAPWQVRERRFRPIRFGRRGLDPAEVQEFLDRVASDLAAYLALGDSRQETARIKDALRRWQSEQAQRANAGRYR